MKIEATQQNIEPPGEQKPPRRPDVLNTDLANHLSSLAFKLALTEEEHNVREPHSDKTGLKSFYWLRKIGTGYFMVN